MKYYITKIEDNQAIITRSTTGEIVHRSKHFRHRWEAEQHADEWIQKHLPNPVTLEIQNMSIDANMILGGKKNG